MDNLMREFTDVVTNAANREDRFLNRFLIPEFIENSGGLGVVIA